MAWLRDLLRGLAAQGRTIIVSSHVLAEVAQTADDIAIVHEGRLRYAGRLAELADGPGALEAAFLDLTAGPADLAAARTDR